MILNLIFIISIYLLEKPKEKQSDGFANFDINMFTYGDVVQKPKYKVKLTTYNATVKQTSSNPNITASGFKIDMNDPNGEKIIAVSKDLLKIFKYGDLVRVTNAGIYDGIYFVRDRMNDRFKSKIDILINNNMKHTSLKNVYIQKI